MDQENKNPRGDWKGENEAGRDKDAADAMKDGAWKGETPLRADDMEENKRLRRDLGQSPKPKQG